ncbi:MAG: hypothetical protein LBD69_01280 [Puniceicoccales bacterium]|nr:hypothetical protein [Puniceicoccales bacterium]
MGKEQHFPCAKVEPLTQDVLLELLLKFLGRLQTKSITRHPSQAQAPAIGIMHNAFCKNPY